ncbi:hypothetical protein Sde_0708 [Saccharophagus degradans 2-40]|uniref:Uncharacterized protein n=1 Tax=Saccharophagus degradans (strain 2-40 / ATCC 43961 / DSM 17024) TaxID=203122 RepID=Q21MV9_SACD2|nr:hypothetical protein Sde_0708 [Saccharophagus degradans 2-40]
MVTSNNRIGDVVVIRNIKTTEIREPIIKAEVYKFMPEKDVWTLDSQTTR